MGATVHFIVVKWWDVQWKWIYPMTNSGWGFDDHGRGWSWEDQS